MSSSADHNGPTLLLTGDGSLTLRAADSGEGYKSQAGALTEARQVYLEGSGVAERLRDGRATSVLEVGFGAGLVFLVTAELAATTGTRLNYTAIEKAPPSADVLARLRYDELLTPSPLPARLIEWRRSLGTQVQGGAHVHRFGLTNLRLLVGDAQDLRPAGPFDAVYHDAFSPATNPELWSPGFLSSLAALLAPAGRLVSFSVAGPVRRALAAAGLVVRKAPGPVGGKREVLVAERPA